MPDSLATILIPDISGFTAFVTSTELSHAAKAINMLLDAILQGVGEEYEVAEIEGDAVLLFRKGLPPSKNEVMATCLSIFDSFHYMRASMANLSLCPCNACRSLKKLTLKFVVHYGPLTEIKVGRFIKPTGPDMIVAHRLLKNGIGSDEYMLMTEKVWQQEGGSPELPGVKWESAWEESSSIGKVPYRFAKLDSLRKKEPPLPKRETCEDAELPDFIETDIASNFRDVYMTAIDIPGRPAWVPGLQNVEQEIPEVYAGSQHLCTFEQDAAIILPLSMELSEEGIRYTEKRLQQEADIAVIYEFWFWNTGEHNCVLASRLLPARGRRVPQEMMVRLSAELVTFCEKLKTHCEAMEGSLFEPSLLTA